MSVIGLTHALLLAAPQAAAPVIVVDDDPRGGPGRAVSLTMPAAEQSEPAHKISGAVAQLTIKNLFASGKLPSRVALVAAPALYQHTTISAADAKSRVEGCKPGDLRYTRTISGRDYFVTTLACGSSHPETYVAVGVDGGKAQSLFINEGEPVRAAVGAN